VTGDGASEALKRSIFVDVSETLVMRGNTGIQRVVRRIVEEGAAPARAAGYNWIPVVATAPGLQRLDPTAMDVLMRPAGLAAAPGESTTRSSLATRAVRLLQTLAPGFYETLRTYRLDRAFAGLIAPQPIRVGPGDIYLVLDSFWLRSAAPRTAERLRRHGRPVVAVIYDVLALTHRDFFVGELPDLLEKQFHRMARAGTRFVSISADAAHQVHGALPAGHRHGVAHFPLGHDLASQAVATLPDPVQPISSLLVVGTLEPRKNHGVVLDAVEQLWAAGWPGTLTIIGKPGWGVEPLLDRLAAHPERNRRLIVEHAASDARLAEAYRSATATIMPSFAEGFGLPVVESMAAGVPVIASDIAVFREILGDDPLLFDPHDPDDLIRSIRHLEVDPARHRARAAAFSWPDWQDSAAALVARVIDQASGQR
jgi:alpha-1,2-rhamnosyltransferase